MKSTLRILYVAVALLCLNLQAADTTPPTVLSISPLPGTTVSNLTQITVVFSEPVTWVQPWVLQVNDTDADAVTGVGYTNFTFTFTQPPPGPVTISWESTQNISDFAGNLFAAGAPWQYTLVDVQRPAVIALSPPANSTVSQFNQISVTFSEPVIGVDAFDLEFSGDSALSVSGAGAGPYIFQVPGFGAGQVDVAWRAGNGITDLASNPLVLTSWIVIIDGAVPQIRINEFLTANINASTGYKDEFNTVQDWIELYNYGATAVNLNGFSLTDDSTIPDQWLFPNVTLGAGQYLIIFASGLDRRVVGGTNRLHTSFKLNPYASYLGLFDAGNPRLSLTEVNYPDQKNDYSYGLDSTNQWRYFVTPTPGATNGNSLISGVVPDVHFSVERGIFNSPFTLLLSVATPGAAIRYTTDGSLPTAVNGFTYTAGLTITNTATLRAAGFFTNMLPSAVVTHTYIFPNGVLNQPNNPAGFPVTTSWSEYGYPSDYGMDPKVVTNPLYSATIKSDLLAVPSLSIVLNVDDMFGAVNGIYTHATTLGAAWQKACSVELINPDGTKGFQANAGIKMHGGGSRARTLKHPMRINFKGLYGPATLNYQFYPDSPVSEFNNIDLRSEYNNHWNHGFDAAQRSRGTMVRDPWFKDVERRMGGVAGHTRYVHLYINGLYWGVYGPSERPDATFAANYYGGEREEYDAVNGTNAKIVDGNATARTFLLGINNLDIPANYELMKQNLDIIQYIDYNILQMYGANQDYGATKNWYAFRRRAPGATWKYLCWDSERTLEVTNQFITVSPDSLQTKLVLNPEYRLTFADRVYKHFFNDGMLTYSGIQASWNARAIQVDRAIVGESARWGDMMTTAGAPGKSAISPLPYPSYTAGTPYTRDENWVGEQYRLFNYYFNVRGPIMVDNFRSQGLYPSVEPPAFSQHGGRVLRGYSLYMSAANLIYYTTNGADPRVYGSGAVSPTALLYSGTEPLVIGDTMVVKARCLSGATWSALHEATFTLGDLLPPLRITEIMYNPIGGDNYEFIEVQNIGATPLDIGGYYFDGISYQFPLGAILNPGARLVLGSNNDTNAWKLRYPGVAVAGWFGAKLADSGEPIRVFNASNQVVLLVDYKPSGGWPALANGAGYSLEIIDPEGDPNDPANWQASATINGTPGLAPVLRPTGSVLINEFMADNVTAVENEGTFPDWVELYNPGPGSVDFLGWSLSDDGNPRKFVFTNSTILQAGGYLVLWCDSPTNGTSGPHTDFGLDRDGDNVYLYDPNTNRVDAISFGAQVADYSLGRVGGVWQLTQPTPNATNVAATLGSPLSLVINEWMANAVKGGVDWLELYNPDTVAPVALRNLYVGTSNDLCQLKAYSFIGPASFLQLLADSSSGARHLDFKLPAEGGYVALFDETGFEIIGSRVTYGPQTEGVSQGRLPDGYVRITTFPGSPSPAAPNYQVSPTGLLLNEVLASHYRAATNTLGHVSDWVELYNSGSTTYYLAGSSLSVDKSEPGQWVFPPGTTVPPQGYLVIWCDGDHPPTSNTLAWPYLNTGRSINADSSGVYLFNTSRQLIDSIEFGFQAEDKSIGRTGTTWQLLASPTPGRANSEPATLGSPLNLRINEWMAAPATGDDWFELYNLDGLPVQLTGLYLTDDPTIAGTTNFMVPPLSFIAVNGFVQWVADGSPSQGRNHVNFNLDAWGESITLYHTNLAWIDRVNYGAQAGGVSQGRLPDGAENIVSFPGTPTPGESNYKPLPNAVINEVLSHALAPKENAIELFNPTGVPRPIGGWYLSNSERNFKKFRIPNGTVLPPGGFWVFYENQFNSSFTLNPAQGDELWLSQTDGNDNLTGYRARAQYAAADPNASFGRFQTSAAVDYPALTQTTFGADAAGTVEEFRFGAGQTNALPNVGPIVINEIMYHPPDIGGANDNTLDEYVELYNLSGTDLPLYDPARPTNRWRLQGGVTFTFTNISLPAGGYLLVVNFNPRTNATQLAAFQTKYGIPGFTNIYGPYAGKLDNGGEEIILTKPGAPTLLPPAPELFVPQIVVDRVIYGDSIPWPSGADGYTNGAGMSLQRNQPSDYGNEPLNWFAGPPTPGATNGSLAPGALPLIVQQPQDAQVVAGASVAFTVSVSGGTPYTYLWFFNSVPILEATNSTLALYNVQPANEGLYTVAVSSPNGTVRSQAAGLVILSSPQIIQPPRSQGAAVGSSPMFSVYATGGGLTYQWQFNGADLPNATNASLTLASVQLSDAGPYRVRISNAFDTVLSDAAYLVMTPPSILTQPVGITNFIGSTVNLSVTVAGDAPLTYQWRKDGVPVFAATNTAYEVSNAPSTISGVYDLLVVNAIGSAVSQPASVAIYVPVQITQQPTNVTVAGVTNEATYGQSFSNVTFTVAASGTSPITYQWQRNGEALPGANASTLLLPNASLADEGYYSALAANPYSAATSAPARLLVTLKPVIRQQPAQATVVTGSVVNFSVVATGNPMPLGYKWFRDVFPVANGYFYTNSSNCTLTLNRVTTANGGAYTVNVTNSAYVNPFAKSANAYLTVVIPPVNKYVKAGSNVTLNVTANCGATYTSKLRYQWRWNGADLPDKTNTSLTLTNFQADREGIYSVVVINPVSYATAFPAEVFLDTDPPIILTQPQSLTVAQNATAVFSVTAGGPGPFSCQWQLNGGNIQDATNQALTLPNVQPSDAGDYTVFITNTNGSATSLPATLTIGFPPSILTQPQDQTADLGGTATFTVAAEGTAPLHYQWQFNGTNILDQTNASLTLANLQIANQGTYRAIITNELGSITSDPASLTLNILPPVIVSAPLNLTVPQGGVAAFIVVAQGTEPLFYQWQFEGANIQNATNSSLILSDVQTSAEGRYSVVVSNAAGSDMAGAVLAVIPPPSILVQPQAQVVNPGDPATFSVTAESLEYMSYQWFLNGVAIPGATESAYSCAAAYYTNAGAYTVEVSNFGGTAQSLPAELAVRPRFTSQALSNGVLLLNYEGAIGKNYDLLSSTLLTNWASQGRLSNTAVQMQFQDTNSLTGSNAIYRLRQVP